MNLYIKNMVCLRCIKAVEQLIAKLPAEAIYVHLGDVLLKQSINEKQRSLLSMQLQQQGFELLDNNLKQQIDKIKTIIIDHIHYNEDKKFLFAEILSTELKREYSVISKLFSKL